MLTAALANFALRSWDRINAHRDSREPDRTEDAARDKVVPLHPVAAPVRGPSGRVAPAGRPAAPMALQDDPALAEMRAGDYYAIGYGEGANAANHEAKDYGCERVRAHLCDGIGRAIGVRVALLDQEQLKLLDVGDQGSSLTRERLRTRMRAIERDIETLKRQIELAQDGAGWLQSMLADYRAGFEHAMREALDSAYEPR